MGGGYFDGQKLHFVVSAEYEFVGTNEADWTAVLQQTSRDLHQATLGQVQFGTVYLADKSLGIADAEILLIDASGESSGSHGGFGTPGQASRLLNDVKSDQHAIVHELGHHLWNLGDEYAAHPRSITIDVSIPAPDLKTVPVDDPLFGGLAVDELKGSLFYVVFDNGALGRATVVSNTASEIRLDADLPNLATNARDHLGYVQAPATCGDPTNTHANFCIMESRLGSVVAFCDPVNHNAGGSSAQQADHGESCWSTILRRAEFAALVPPPGPAPMPTQTPTNIVRLTDTARFALVIDRSGSMAGDQLRYAKAGVSYWLENLVGTEDQISIIAFSSQPHVTLPLTPGSALNVAAVSTAVGSLTASGETDIRDSIIEGVNQIKSLPGLSAVQACVLLTDGQHNRPPGTHVSEVLQELRDSHVKLAAIGLGGSADVDMGELNDLATLTNGFSTFVEVNPSADLSAIETAMIDAMLRLTGEVFDSASFDVLPPPPAIAKEAEPKLKSLYGRRSHVPLAEVGPALGVDVPSLQRTGPRLASQQFIVHPFVVEDGCEAINATINFRSADVFDLWLIGPDGHELQVGANVRGSTSTDHPHRFWAVDRPRPGTWKAVGLRLPSRSAAHNREASVLHLVVGGRHRVVRAFARTRKVHFVPNEAVVFEAGAQWTHSLTGLQVEAEIRDSSGHVHRVPLYSGGVLSSTAGQYVGTFYPNRAGLHRATVRFVSARQALRADGLYLACHAPFRQSVDLRVQARPFQRAIRLSFEVGK